MTQAVEGYFLLYPCIGNPLFQRVVSHCASKSFEHQSFAPFTAEFQCLVANGKCRFGFGFLGTDADIVALISPISKSLHFSCRMSLIRNPVIQAKSDACFNTGIRQGVAASCFTSSSVRYSFLTSFHSILSRKSLRFSRSIFSLYAIFSKARNVE